MTFSLPRVDSFMDLSAAACAPDASRADMAVDEAATLGGELGDSGDNASSIRHADTLPCVSLREEDLEQHDGGRNGDIWGIYPVDGGYGLDGMDALGIMRAEARQECHRLIAADPGRRDRPTVLRLRNVHERGRIAGSLRTLGHIYAGLIAGEHYFPPIVDGGLVTFLDTLKSRKYYQSIHPLQSLLVCVREKKTGVDASYFRSASWAAAMAEYAMLLTELYPWTATPLLLNAEVAFRSGLAQLESALWSQVTITALHLAHSDHRWLYVAENSAHNGIEMRYATPKSLATSYWCAAEAALRLHGPSAHSDRLRARAFQILDADNGERWVHEKCIIKHVCRASDDPLPQSRSASQDSSEYCDSISTTKLFYARPSSPVTSDHSCESTSTIVLASSTPVIPTSPLTAMSTWKPKVNPKPTRSRTSSKTGDGAWWADTALEAQVW